MVTKSGRQTKNSNGNRRRKYPSIGRRTPVPKSGRRGRKKDSSNLQDPTSYKSDDGVVYKPGGVLTVATLYGGVDSTTYHAHTQ